MIPEDKEETWYTIDRIDGDGKRVYGCGVFEYERAADKVAQRMYDNAALAMQPYYRIRCLGYCTFAEAKERANKPETMPLGRMPWR